MNWNGNTVLVNTSGEHWPHKNVRWILSNHGHYVWWAKRDCYKHRKGKHVIWSWTEEGEERKAHVIYYFFFCVCVVHIYECAHSYVNMYVEARRWHWVLPLGILHLYWDMVSTDYGVHQSCRLTGQQAPGVFLSSFPPPQYGDAFCRLPHWPFTHVLSI